MATDLTPRARPKLPPVTAFPDEPPIVVPGDVDDGPTLAWCEALRDHYEKEGQLLTVPGLLKVCDAAGLDPAQTADLKKQVRRLYAAEHDSAQGKSPPTPKKEKTVTATATPKKATAKKVAKPKPVSAKTAAKTKPTANGHAVAKVVFDKTVRGLKVVVAKNGDRMRVTVDDIPLRKVLQWMGKAGFVPGEAKAAACILFKDFKGGEAYVASLIEEGQVGAGKNADKDGRTVFGQMADVPAATAKALKALKK